MILFLDFDGVLHPEAVGTDELCHLPNLEKLLRELPLVDLVLSTSWRIVYPPESLLGIFSPDIRERVLGMTPDLDDIPPEMRDKLSTFLRQAEIEAWVLQNSAKGGYIVVDDCGSAFSPDWEPLFLVDPKTGLTPEHLHRLRERLLTFQPASD